MRINKLLCVLLCLSLLFCGMFTARAEGVSEFYTVAQVESLCDGIVAYNGANGAQDFIEGALCANAGTTAEFYAIALSQSGDYRFSDYESALLSYLDSHTVGSAASREKYALALSAAGSTDRYIADTADEAIGGLGLMSLVFGLHLLNNGYDSALYSADGLVSEILSWQKDDGGWAVMGSYGDVDVTAMTIQALAPCCYRGDVSEAVDRALDLLSDRQLDSGGFKTMGAENCESAAQVIIALSALGLDAQSDGRFIKNGNSPLSAMMGYYRGGGFAHTDSVNDTATEEAFCALTAYKRYCYGQGSLYLLDHVNHSAPSDSGSSGGSGNSDSGSGRSQNGSAGSASDSASRGSGSHPDGRTGGSDSENRGGDAEVRVETDSSGNRIIVINGQRYIEATTASGELMTISVSETEDIGESGSGGVRPTIGGFQPGATADSRKTPTATADESGGSGGYKLWAILIILGAAGGACALLFALKKRNKKNYIAVLVIAAAGILFILLTDFKSPEDYRQAAVSDGELTVTLSIRCDTIVGQRKVNRYIPDDGVILDTTACTAEEGDTVYDVLLRAAAERNISLDNRGAPGAAYIAGINALYEFAYGDLSGWMYRVNGEFPDVGCQSCTVSDGDVIEWLYTTDIGKDLN